MLWLFLGWIVSVCVVCFPFFFARCCLDKVPGGAPFNQLHKGDGKIARTISCKYTTKTFKQTSGSNKFLIAGDGKMKRMRDRTHRRDASNERVRVQSSARGSIEAFVLFVSRVLQVLGVSFGSLTESSR